VQEQRQAAAPRIDCRGLRASAQDRFSTIAGMRLGRVRKFEVV
jgi:hypothetical protein